MSIKINSLEVENVKRIKAIKVDFTVNGLTVIGGNNGQGKTSVLDAICWVLGGKKYQPTNAKRDGAMVDPNIKAVLSNGLIVERKGKNSELKVIDPTGATGGQTLLNKFVEELAINLPKFMQQNSKDKAKTLLQILGIGDQLQKLEQEETNIYNQRHALGQIADRKKKYADELPFYEDAPKDLVTPNELIQKQQAILAKNGENQAKRTQVYTIQNSLELKASEVENLQNQIEDMQKRLIEKLNEKDQLATDLKTAQKSTEQLQDESTTELEQQINDIESINVKVRSNFDKQKAEDEAEKLQEEYEVLTGQIEKARQARMDLLQGAQLPLPELTIENSELVYKGQKWDCMSGSEQLIVASSIVRKLNPDCGFVLLDKLEQMDIETMKQFGEWLESESLQAIATRVSNGDECSIIIEDGQAITAQITPKAF